MVFLIQTDTHNKLNFRTKRRQGLTILLLTITYTPLTSPDLNVMSSNPTRDTCLQSEKKVISFHTVALLRLRYLFKVSNGARCQGLQLKLVSLEAKDLRVDIFRQ